MMLTACLMFVVGFYGFLHFSLCIDKNFRLIYGEKAPGTVVFGGYQCIGWLCVVLSLLPALGVWGNEIGVAVWVLILQTSAFLVVLLINSNSALYRFLWQYLCVGSLLFVFQTV